MLASAERFEWARLVTFTNYSGEAGGAVAPRSEHVGWLFLLGLMLPAYTVSGYDASAHTAEETIGAAQHVPRGIVQSVLVSGIFLYLSYGLPTAAGFFAHSRTWTKMGPWQVGRWYRPLAVVAVLGCLLILAIGVQPPNEQAIWIVGGAGGVLTIVWFARER